MIATNCVWGLTALIKLGWGMRKSDNFSAANATSWHSALLVVHCCTMSLSDIWVPRQQRNPNMNNKDHLVVQLTRSVQDCIVIHPPSNDQCFPIFFCNVVSRPGKLDCHTQVVSPPLDLLFAPTESLTSQTFFSPHLFESLISNLFVWKFDASVYYLIVAKVCPQSLVLDHHHEEEDGKDDSEADEHYLEWKLSSENCFYQSENLEWKPWLET